MSTKFLGKTDRMFRLLGRTRRTSPSDCCAQKSLSLRLASIDIGGGTSDLMITDYRPQQGSAIHSTSLCQEGFSVAGDEVVKQVIKDLVSPMLVKALSLNNPGSESLVKQHFKDLFSSSPPDTSAIFEKRRKQWLDQILIPLSHSFLGLAAEHDGPETHMFQDFFDIFVRAGKHYDTNVMHSFLENFINPIPGVGWHPFDNIRWRISKGEVNRVVRSTLMSMLKIFAQAIALYKCDVVLLAGKFSAIPAVRDILVDFCPIPPSRILSLTNFEVGSWYPFDKRSNRIKDAKTTVAVGSALWYFAGRQRMLNDLSISEDKRVIENADLFVGELRANRVDEADILFPEGRRAKRFLEVNGPVKLGSRFLDCNLAHCNMLYEISVNREKNFVFPIKLALSQDQVDKSVIRYYRAKDAVDRMVYKDDVCIQLRTLEQDRYWLDEGRLW